MRPPVDIDLGTIPEPATLASRIFEAVGFSRAALDRLKARRTEAHLNRVARQAVSEKRRKEAHELRKLFHGNSFY